MTPVWLKKTPHLDILCPRGLAARHCGISHLSPPLCSIISLKCRAACEHQHTRCQCVIVTHTHTLHMLCVSHVTAVTASHPLAVVSEAVVSFVDKSVSLQSGHFTAVDVSLRHL